MILKFRHKGLEQFFKTGSKAGILPRHAKRLRLILTHLKTAQIPQDMDIAGFDLHQLSGPLWEFWSVSVSGNWRVIFRFEDTYVTDVDYLDYH